MVKEEAVMKMAASSSSEISGIMRSG